MICTKKLAVIINEADYFSGWTWDLDGTFGDASQTLVANGSSGSFSSVEAAYSSGIYLHGTGVYSGPVSQNYVLIINDFTSTVPGNNYSRIYIYQDGVTELLYVDELDFTGPFPQSFPFTMAAGVASPIELYCEGNGLPNVLAYEDGGFTSDGSIDFVIERV